MLKRNHRSHWGFAVIAALGMVQLVSAADYEPPILIRDAKIITRPGETIEKGHILIENGRISGVSPEIKPPANAEIFDATGLIVYPGFIDANTHAGLNIKEPEQPELNRLLDKNPDVREGIQSASVEGYRRLMHPSWRAEEKYDRDAAKLDSHHRAGFTAALISPPVVIFSGRSAVIQLGDLPARRSILKINYAQHAAFVIRRADADPAERSRGYPTTTMGAIAAFRQIMDDALWQRDLLAWSKQHPQEPRPAIDRDLEALWDVHDKSCRLAIWANKENEIHRALNVAAEYKITPIIVGGKEAWRVADRLKAENVPVILSLKWSDETKKPKNLKDAESTTQPSAAEAWLDRKPLFDDEWEAQPFESEKTYDERIRLRNEEIDNAKVLAEAGVRFAIGTDELKSPDDVLKNLREIIKRGLSEDAALAALSSDAAAILSLDSDLGAIAATRLANLTFMDKPIADEKAKVKWVFVEGKPLRLKQDDAKDKKKDRRNGKTDEPIPPEDEEEEKAQDIAEAMPPPKMPEVPSTQPVTTQPGESATSQPISSPADKIEFPHFESEIEADRKPKTQTGGNILIKNANLLTLSNGDLIETDILVRDGKIAEIGKDLPASRDIMTIDLRGYFVTPGIIDCHSHMCSAGGLNEFSLSVTPEVRVADVIESREVEPFRALAGGVTMIHTMHGSANTIGGQNVVLRLKYGRPTSEWRFEPAPQTVKFALGENVKHSNFHTERGSRFPITRMGVEAVMHRAFDAAWQYKKDWGEYKDAKASVKSPRPLRRDLRLEALSNILDGLIWVHCHCYRADEILRLFAVAEEHGIRIGVLQHILEGYRIIPEIRRHGCAASTFSDWWAYKIESFDAIPHNAARMLQAGIASTVNSDSPEVVRHLNLESAKCMRFGGLSPNEALALCTINGAISLGVEKHVGSLEAGKLADLAIFNGHPLDTFSKCVLTLIDGEIYFQHPSLNLESPATAIEPRKFVESRAPLKIETSAVNRYRIVGGTIHRVSGKMIEDGQLVIADGKIERIGLNDDDIPPPDTTTIDAAGLHIYPGLINAGVPLGLVEIDSVTGTVDTRDTTKFQPDLFALSAFNPFSSEIEVARSEGITTALLPALGQIVGGQGGIVHMDGWSMPEARVIQSAGLFVSLPSMPLNLDPRLTDEKKEERRKEIRDRLAETEDFFRKARTYAQTVTAADADPSLEPDKDRVLLEMAPYLQKERPVFFIANSYKEIVEALAFAEKYDVEPVVYGGREAWKLADTLASKKVDVIVVRSMGLPGDDFEPWDSVYRNAGRLHRAGVRFCFATSEASLAKQLGVEAGMAVAHGLEPNAAIAAMTLNSARILGIDDRFGSLEEGKVADLIITTDTPLQASNCVVAEFIEGRPIDLSNKHTRSDEMFRNRPEPKLPPEVELRGPTPRRNFKTSN